MSAPLAAALGLGFLLGMRHATDPDHVVAVTTIVSRERTLRSAATVGALWGLGHTATVALAGGAIVAFGLVVPPRLGLALELAVAAMLVVLGVVNVAATRGPAAPAFVKSRSFAVGVVHGLAGSAAIALLVLATIRAVGWAVLYLALFGAGTVAGMVLLTVALAVPAKVAAARLVGRERWLVVVSGLASIAFGLVLAYEVGFVGGLFTAAPVWTPH